MKLKIEYLLLYNIDNIANLIYFNMENIDIDDNNAQVNEDTIDTKLVKFGVMISLTGSFFLIELIFSIIIKSLALQADSFHMLSDLIAIIVALTSYKLSMFEASDTATYGWIRAEVIGGLINGVFLVSSCFFIVLETIQKFINYDTIGTEFGNIDNLLIVASIGLLINVVGAIMFSCGTSHSHIHSHGHSHGHSHNSDDLNIKALMLHIIGDILGSIAVIVSALIIKFVDNSNNMRFLADPIASLIIVIIIISSAIPIIKKCYVILVHHVSNKIDVTEIKENIQSLDGIINIHDFHVWNLDDMKVIGTMHISISNQSNFIDLSNQIEIIMHNYGIHATTIQPEFVSSIMNRNDCSNIICDKSCESKNCC